MKAKVTSNVHVNQIHALLDSPTRGPGRTLTFNETSEKNKAKQKQTKTRQSLDVIVFK